MAASWSCAKCTFRHRYPSQRCQMCGSPRATREETRDFAAGGKADDGGEEGGGGGRKSGEDDGSGSARGQAGISNSGGNPPNPHSGPGSSSRPDSSAATNSNSFRGRANPYAKRPRPPAGPSSNPRPNPHAERSLGAPVGVPARPDSNSNPRASNKKREAPAARNPHAKRPREEAPASVDGDPGRSGRAPPTVSNPHRERGDLQNNRQGAVLSSDGVDEGGMRRGTNSHTSSPRGNSAETRRPSTPDERTAPPSPRSDREAAEGRARPAPSAASGRPRGEARDSRGDGPPYRPGPVPLSPRASRDWIYPASSAYPERSYQLQMAEAAIFSNTLVSLPTGLGKTLVAAVVMYNYYRWFPGGKVVFCAPTRPLVTQQIQACYNIMGIPELHTAEMVGNTKSESRRRLWESKRAFFCTPQTLVNDIKGGRCRAESIVCVVMDEAHKATGNHANALLVDMIKEKGAKFRLVALSATPGTDIKSIQSVVTTLSISRIEAKTEEDPDVGRYIHRRAEEVCVVEQPTAVDRLDGKFGELIQPLLDRLREERVGARLFQNASALKPFTVFQAKDEYVRRTQDRRLDGHFAALHKFVSLRVSLKVDGVSVVRNKLKTLERNGEKGILGQIIREPRFQSLLLEMCQATLSTQVGENEAREDLTKNNPKYEKLLEILVGHFQRNGQDTRIIIFSQYRDSVDGIVSMLKAQNNPVLKPHSFIGQSKKSTGKKSKSTGIENPNSGQDLAGMNQVQQQRVLGQFNQGIYNILVCTSVGEEGLDIGEVDLIVNFDILKSSIRSIQRCGRTGRKRDGRVIFLVSKGAEEKAYEAMMENKKRIANALKSSKKFKLCSDPPMFPVSPTLLRQKMTVSNFRMSQVGGHTPKGSKRSANSAHGNKALGWELSAAQDEQRKQLFGDLPESSLLGYEFRRFPLSLRRDYLKSRERSIVIKRYRRDGNESAPLIGSHATFLKRLEKKYLPTNKTLSLSPLDEALANFQSTQKNSSDCISLANDDASIYMSDASPAASVRCASFDVEDLTNSPHVTHQDDGDALDAIFGVGGNGHISKIDGNDLLSLFDSYDHRHCSVPPPPGCGMAVSNESDYDESDDGSSVFTKSSQLSVNTQNDDILCDFFDSTAGKLKRLVNDETAPIIGTCNQQGDVDEDVTSEVSIPQRKTEDATEVDHDPPSSSVGELLNLERGVKVSDLDTSCDHQDAFSGDDCFNGDGTFKPDISDEQESDQNAVDCKAPVGQYPSASCRTSGIETDTVNFMQNEDAALGNSQEPIHDLDAEMRECTGEKENNPSSTPLSIDNKKDLSLPSLLEAALSNDEFSSTMQYDKSNDSNTTIVALQLPTPPDSSDDSDSDDSSTDDAVPENTFLDESKIVFNEGSHSSDVASNPSAQQECPSSFQIDESFDPLEVSNTVVPLQLPTQYSSSSSDEDSEEEASVDSNDVVEAPMSRQVKSPINFCNEEVDDNNLRYSRAPPLSSLKSITNLANKSLSCDDLVDTPEPMNVKFKAAITHMSPDDLTDTPVICRSNLHRPKLASDGLSDTPAKNAEVKGKGPKRLAGHRKRLRPAPSREKENQQTKSTSVGNRQERVKKRIEEKYRCRFLDAEAALDGSDEDSDEEDVIRNIEEEEADNSFINDSSQLGYTQDDLDCINADEEVSEALRPDESLLHRQLNHQKNVAEQFKTPIFNRKMMRSSLSPNVPPSQRGLGNMNFIKSVLEHHRQGGESNEIEEEYHRLVGKCPPNHEQDWGSPISIVDSPEKSSQHFRQDHPSSSSAGTTSQNAIEPNGFKTLHSRGPISKPAAALTADQKAMIEAKRLAALKRRQERMQHQQQPAAIRNPYAK